MQRKDLLYSPIKLFFNLCFLLRGIMGEGNNHLKPNTVKISSNTSNCDFVNHTYIGKHTFSHQPYLHIFLKVKSETIKRKLRFCQKYVKKKPAFKIIQKFLHTMSSFVAWRQKKGECIGLTLHKTAIYSMVSDNN